MNKFENIKQQLEKNGITKDFLDFYNTADNFKTKVCLILAIVISVLTISLNLQNILEHANYLHNTFLKLTFGIYIVFFQPLVLTLILRLISPLNGFVFKSLNRFLPNKKLNSIVSRFNSQDKTIERIFENKELIKSILDFYTFLSRINFSSSRSSENIDIEIALDKISSIVKKNDSKKFVTFLKENFLSDLQKYSTHPKVVTMLEWVDKSQESINLDKPTETIEPVQQFDDLTLAMKDELWEFKNKNRDHPLKKYL